MKVLLWSIPFLVIPASFVFWKYFPFRKARWCLYAVVLIAAFFMNLSHVSFRNELFDVAGWIGVNFILAEFFWNLLKVKNRNLFMIVFILALCAYGFEFRHWFAAGTENVYRLWAPQAAGTYRRGSSSYTVREYVLYCSVRPTRSIVLSKQLGKTLFEKQMKRYRTPRGYGGVAITYRWSDTPEGIRLDIYAAGRRIWTMGEGF